jgi:hypothetical protein
LTNCCRVNGAQANYKGLSPQQQAENFATLFKYTEEFDKRYGTHLIEGIINTAATLP